VETGAVRVSLAHYNTTEEVKRLGAVLARLRLPAGGAQREPS
jgi:selenocysteine lyase/cysteine desulfurase